MIRQTGTGQQSIAVAAHIIIIRPEASIFISIHISLLDKCQLALLSQRQSRCLFHCLLICSLLIINSVINGVVG